MQSAFEKAENFARRFGFRLPILLAPMAGACPTSLSIAVMEAGGLGACGALMMKPDEILGWASEVRSNSTGAFQINLWIPENEPVRDLEHEARVRAFLEHWGASVPPEAGDARPLDFDDQCDALLESGAPIVSSIMGTYPARFVERLKARGIAWFATATTVTEARAAVAAGADVIVAQGAEAGGHRGAFDATRAESQQVGLFALLPAIVDAVDVPVVATGGIADKRGVIAALALGASAVQIGTGFLRCPEAGLHPAWADALLKTLPEDTVVTRAFSGRPGRAIATDFAKAAMSSDAPAPAPFPVQRGLTGPMRAAGGKSGDIHRMQVWAGQSAAMARNDQAGQVASQIWNEALGLALERGSPDAP